MTIPKSSLSHQNPQIREVYGLSISGFNVLSSPVLSRENYQSCKCFTVRNIFQFRTWQLTLVNKSAESHLQVFLTGTGVSIGNKDKIIYQMDLRDYAVQLYCGLLIGVERHDQLPQHCLCTAYQRGVFPLAQTQKDFLHSSSALDVFVGKERTPGLWLLLVHWGQKEEAGAGWK